MVMGTLRGAEEVHAPCGSSNVYDIEMVTYLGIDEFKIVGEEELVTTDDYSQCVHIDVCPFANWCRFRYTEVFRRAPVRRI
jgi:hypothetical protein